MTFLNLDELCLQSHNFGPWPTIALEESNAMTWRDGEQRWTTRGVLNPVSVKGEVFPSHESNNSLLRQKLSDVPTGRSSPYIGDGHPTFNGESLIMSI